MIGHMEAELGEEALEEGRLRVAIAFADLAGYARLTVEQGDEVARRRGRALRRRPSSRAARRRARDQDARRRGDGRRLRRRRRSPRWAVELQAARRRRASPPPRIGMHYGEALYRDGDYFGREVNQAARVVARARRRRGARHAPGRGRSPTASTGCSSSAIGEVRLKGFSEPTELFIASRARARLERRRRCADARCARRCARGAVRARPAGARDALRRARLDLPARRRGRAARRGRGQPRCTSTTGCAREAGDGRARTARELCAAARRRARGRAGAARPPEARAGQPAGVGARAALRRGRAARAASATR